jgi:opacity protein-like surface antigen
MLAFRIIILVFFAFNFNLLAQIEAPRPPKESTNQVKINQSTLFASGSTNLSAINFIELENNKNKRLAVNASPSIAFVVANNLLLGVSFLYKYEKETSVKEITNQPDINDERSTRSSVLSLFTRFYMTNGKVKPFLGLRAGLGRNTINDFSIDNNGQLVADNGLPTQYLSLGASAGVSYFLNPNISIDGSLEYGRNTTEKDGSNSIFGTNFGFSFFFGNK